MARIIRDTSAFIPGATPEQQSRERDKTQQFGGWLNLANAAVSSPLVGALIRGGQLAKHGIEDARLKKAAERYNAMQQRAIAKSPTPLVDTGGGFTLQEPEGETIFGKGALSQEPPAPSWSSPRPSGEDRWSVDLPDDVDTEAPTGSGPRTAPVFGEAPAAGPTLDVARGELPGGPSEAKPPAAVGIEPKPERESSRALVDKAWTPRERMIFPADDAAPPVPPLAQPGKSPVAAEPTTPATKTKTNFYPETPEELSWAAEVAKIHGMLAKELPTHYEGDHTMLVRPSTELHRDTDRPALALANDAALRDIESKPPELLNRAIAALESANTPLARSRAEAIRQELRRREQVESDAREVEEGREDAATLAAAPLEVAELWQKARAADTLEKQAEVLRDVQRTRAPISSFADLISGEPQDRLMAQARALFPPIADASGTEVQREIQRLKAQELAEKVLGYAPQRRLREAQAGLAEERADQIEDEAPDKAAERGARADRMRAQAENARAQAADRRGLLDARRKKLEADTDAARAKIDKMAVDIKLALAKFKMARKRVGGGKQEGERVKHLLKLYETVVKDHAEAVKSADVLEHDALDFARKQREIAAKLQADAEKVRPASDTVPSNPRDKARAEAQAAAFEEAQKDAAKAEEAAKAADKAFEVARQRKTDAASFGAETDDLRRKLRAYFGSKLLGGPAPAKTRPAAREIID